MAIDKAQLTGDLKLNSEANTEYKPTKKMMGDLSFSLCLTLGTATTSRIVVSTERFWDMNRTEKRTIVGSYIRDEDVEALSVLLPEAMLNHIRKVFGNPAQKQELLNQYMKNPDDFINKFDYELIKAICVTLEQYDHLTFRNETDLADKCHKFQIWYLKSLMENYASGKEYKNGELKAAVSDIVQIVDTIAESQKHVIWQDFRNWLNVSKANKRNENSVGDNVSIERKKEADSVASDRKSKDENLATNLAVNSATNSAVNSATNSQSTQTKDFENAIESCQDVLQLSHFFASMQKENHGEDPKQVLLKAYETYRSVNKFVSDSLQSNQVPQSYKASGSKY